MSWEIGDKIAQTAVCTASLGFNVVQLVGQGAALPWQVAAGVIAGMVTCLLGLLVLAMKGYLDGDDNQKSTFQGLSYGGGALGILAPLADRLGFLKNYFGSLSPAFIWFNVGFTASNLIVRVLCLLTTRN